MYLNFIINKNSLLEGLVISDSTWLSISDKTSQQYARLRYLTHYWSISDNDRVYDVAYKLELTPPIVKT